MKATKFGRPFSFSGKPSLFSGYYKYQAGETYTDKNFKPVEGKTDKGTIYVVLYDNHDANGNAVVMYGDNVQTSEQMVALAQVFPAVETTMEWMPFNAKFVYCQEIDANKLHRGGYSLAIA